MQLIITGKNRPVPDRLDEYVRRKIGKLERYLTDPAEAQVELSEESTKNAQHRQVVQVTIYKNGTIVRGEERSGDMSSAIDAVVDKLERQIKRYKEKNVARKRRAQPLVEELSGVPMSGEPRIVRIKRFPVPPMSEEEAIDQMELLGHSFFVFHNQTNGKMNVVYKREDGNYGLLEPDSI